MAVDISRNLDVIRERFLTNLRGHIAVFADVYHAIEAGNARSVMIEETKIRAHKIHGSAATLGFQMLGERACSVEIAATEYLKLGVRSTSPDPFMDELAALLLATYEAIAGKPFAMAS